MERRELAVASALYTRRARQPGSSLATARAAAAEAETARCETTPKEEFAATCATAAVPRPPTGADVRHFQAQLCIPCGNKLGECPLWDDQKQLLCWIDIQGSKFWQYDPSNGPEEAQCFDLPSRPGSFCLCEHGEYLFAFEDGFSFYDPVARRRLRVTENFEAQLRTRLNDGRVDHAGRFVSAGTVEKGDEPLSAVYRVNTDFTVETLHRGVRCGNSICFTTHGGMFFTDPAFTGGKQQDEEGDHFSGCNTIWHFPDYAASGMSRAVPFVEADGRPDGSIIDEEGCLWNAEFGGGRVVRYRQDGTVDMVVDVPTKYTTCAAFGGQNLDTLYITDASIFAASRLSKKRRPELAEGLAGGLFCVRLPVRGCREARFAGSSALLLNR